MFIKAFFSALIGMAAACASAADFSDLRKEMAELRASKNEDAALFVASKGHTVELKKFVYSTMDTAAAEAAAAQSRSMPTLKLSSDGNWIEYVVDDDTTVMRPVTASGDGDASRSFQMRKITMLKAFPDADWASFVEFAIQNGMMGFRVDRVQESRYSDLLFYPRTYRTINAGGTALTLPPQFNQLMGFSRKYQGTGGSKGFVILVHDPHQNVAGRFQSLSGLRYLLQANASNKFQFLVEGKYGDPSRVIGLAGLDAKLPEDTPATSAAVHALLAKFVINVPLAYRVLYARDLPAYAIDDNTKLSYQAAGTPRALDERLGSLAAIVQSVRSAQLPPDRQAQKESLLNSSLMSLVFLTADIRGIGDEALLDHFTALTKMLRDTSGLAGRLKSSGLQVADSDISGLAADARYFDAELVAYRNAYERNRTMSREIIRRVSNDGRISVAFIGSYHTQGVTKALRAAGIGYVVIEPHARSQTTAAEAEAFDRANLGTGRSAYLASLRLNMGLMGPSLNETTQMSSRLDTVVKTVANHTAAARESFAAIPGNRVDADRLAEALGHNAGLSSVRRSAGAGGGAPPIPPKFANAFAFFEPDRGGGGGNGRSTLLLLDPTSERWQDRGRYEFLSLALFKAQEKSQHSTPLSHMMFYRDPTDGRRLYATVYDPASDRIYAFEGGPDQIAAFVPKPDAGDGKRGFIRMQVVELDKAGKEASNG